MTIAIITLPHTLNSIYKDVTRACDSNSKWNRWWWNSRRQSSTPKMLALINTMALVGVKVAVWGYKWPTGHYVKNTGVSV